MTPNAARARIAEIKAAHLNTHDPDATFTDLEALTDELITALEASETKAQQYLHIVCTFIRAIDPATGEQIGKQAIHNLVAQALGKLKAPRPS